MQKRVKKSFVSSIDTERRIQGALLEMLEKNPSSKITISELAGKVDIHRSTIYRYYSNIEEVLDACTAQIIESLMAIIRDHISEVTQGNALFMMRDIVALVESNERYFSVALVHKRVSFRDELFQAIQADESLFKSILHTEVKSHLDLAIDCFNIDFIFGGIIASVEGWLRRGGSQYMTSNAVAVQGAGWFNVLTALCESNKDALGLFDTTVPDHDMA